jgi:hypothetical protein
MAASEMYDFLSDVVPDYDYTLTVKAQGDAVEDGHMNQVVHMADDYSEERVTLGTTKLFYVSWNWALLSEATAGTIVDLYYDPTKANGIARSFKWLAYDGHTYVIRFDCNLQRVVRRAQHGVSNVKFRVLGRIADA